MKRLFKIIFYSVFYFFIYSTIFMKQIWIDFFNRYGGYGEILYKHVLAISIFYFICLFIELIVYLIFKKIDKNY